MSESIQPNLLTRLRFTPLTDLFRGDVNGRLHWSHVISSAVDLPQPIGALIRRVVKRTRLWRSERRALVDELIAHFRDGLAAGDSAEQLIARFGDERLAAKLMTRAKRRNRPLLWHAQKYATRTLFVLLGIYGLVLIRFFASSPIARVDYVAKLNESAERAPTDQRAWPLYRQALIALQIAPRQNEVGINQPFFDEADEKQVSLIDLTPTSKNWPVLVAWLDAHRDAIEQVRVAAEKPSLGFILGPGGSQNDDALGWSYASAIGEPDNQLLLSQLLLPDLDFMREMACLLAADVRAARTKSDGQRIVDDLSAMLGIARQLDDPILITRLTSIGIDGMAIDQVRQILRDEPDMLTRPQLVALAHRISIVGGDAPSSLVDLSGEQMFFDDAVQRIYSDDGHGDGHLTSAGTNVLSMISPPGKPGSYSLPPAGSMALTGGMSILSSRREAVSEYHNLMQGIAAELARPLRYSVRPGNGFERAEQRIREIKSSPMLSARYLPISLLFPSVLHSQQVAERTLGLRDGCEIAIALEMTRRDHGAFPQTLASLSPTLLPTVPVDRITGDPLRYRLIDGRPLVYSVGADRKDDGGEPAHFPNHNVDQSGAAIWPAVPGTPIPDGDWILFDGRPLK